MKNLITFTFLFFCQMNLFGQFYDANCVSGKPFNAVDSSQFAGYITNYMNNWPVNKLTKFDKTFSRGMTVSSNKGNLLFYTNGVVVYNNKNIKIEEGDRLSPGYYENLFNLNNLPYPFAHYLALPIANSDSIYYLFHPYHPPPDSVIIGCSGSPERIYYSQIDMRINQGLGKVINKNQLLVKDSTEYLDAPMATKHANGRDWWIVIPQHKKIGYYTFLMTPNELKYYDLKNFGQTNDSIFNCSYCAKMFSPDGKTYIDYNQNKQLSIFDFDRCTGDLSNYRDVQLAQFGVNQAPAGGIVFSPNGRFIYITMLYKVIQFDLEAADILASAVVVLEDYTPNQSSSFRLNTALDGRVYFGWGNSLGNAFMRYIAFPNEKGIACMTPNNKLVSFGKFVHGVTSPYPNYRLGPIDGSICDSLGIDNRPLARFRWDISDTSGRVIRFTDNSFYEPTTFSWDFGDGSSSTEQNPYHTYQNDGVYHVCETVCNQNGCDTFCTDVVIGVSQTEDFDKIEALVIYPNPTTDKLFIGLPEFTGAEKLTAKLTDPTGKTVFSHTFEGCIADLDLPNLAAGLYFVQVFEFNRLRAVGKVVIQH